MLGEDGSFRAHEEENVTVEKTDENAHAEKDPIGRFRSTHAFVQADNGTGDSTINGHNG